jgi:polyisoprenoid-binding protein YceI
MKWILTWGYLVAVSPVLLAQSYVSERSDIHFFSKTPLEDIDAINTQSASLFNATTGEIAFAIPVAAFVFAKSLMQEHFNESYLETEKYPRATFKGLVKGFEHKDGVQRVRAVGELYIHGVTRPATVEGTLERKANTLLLVASFPVKLEDYRVKVPRVVFYNVAETVEVKINMLYRPHAK